MYVCMYLLCMHMCACMIMYIVCMCMCMYVFVYSAILECGKGYHLLLITSDGALRTWNISKCLSTFAPTTTSHSSHSQSDTIICSIRPLLMSSNSKQFNSGGPCMYMCMCMYVCMCMCMCMCIVHVYVFCSVLGMYVSWCITISLLCMPIT